MKRKGSYLDDYRVQHRATVIGRRGDNDGEEKVMLMMREMGVKDGEKML